MLLCQMGHGKATHLVLLTFKQMRHQAPECPVQTSFVSLSNLHMCLTAGACWDLREAHVILSLRTL